MNETYSQFNCGQLKAMLDQSSFAMDDVLLFLDTHPCDQAALAYYQSVSRMRRDALAAYQTNCGPVMVDGVNSANGYWNWIQGPWPWEGGR